MIDWVTSNPRKLLSSKQDHSGARSVFSRFFRAGYALKTQLMAFRAVDGVVTPAARNEDGGAFSAGGY